MNSEKLMILKMLEDKTITADEAARLMEHIGEPGAPAAKAHSDKPPVPVLVAPQHSEAFTFAKAEASKVPELTIAPPIVFADLPTASSAASTETPSAPTAASAASASANPASAKAPVYGESVAEEIGRKLSGFMHRMEPTLQKFATSLVGKTAEAADSLSRTASAPFPRSEPAKAPTTTRPGAERLFEMTVAAENSELVLAGLNGSVSIKGYNGDKLSVKVLSIPVRGGAEIDLAVLGSKYILRYEENDFKNVHIDAFVPAKLFDSIRLSTTNGALTASALTTTNCKLETLNGDTEATDIIAENAVIECHNGKLALRGITAACASIECFNGPIAATNTDIAQMKMNTYNGPINLQLARFQCFNDYEWEVESNNAKMNLALPTASAALGYKVHAHSTLGTVKLWMSGLAFSRKETSFAEAQSLHYSSAEKKVHLNLAASNALLEVH